MENMYWGSRLFYYTKGTAVLEGWPLMYSGKPSYIIETFHDIVTIVPYKNPSFYMTWNECTMIIRPYGNYLGVPYSTKLGGMLMVASRSRKVAFK